MMKSRLDENEIASQFSSLLTLNQRKNFINNLPEKINPGRILKNLKSDNDKAEFVKLLFKKEPFFYKFMRNYKKERAAVLKRLAAYKDNYKKVRGVLNGLRKENKVLLKDEAVKIAQRRKKSRKFYDSIFKAEAFADLIKENNYNSDLLNKLLIKNNDLISQDKIFLDNLKDIFEFDGYLNNLNDDFGRFVINNVESGKSAREIILNAEEKILSGDISNIYDEIEKTEKLLSNNMPQMLLNIYRSIDVMDSKKNFVTFIEEAGEEGISGSDIDILRNKSNGYRNIDLPGKWNEMKHKLKFTQTIHHFIAWYYGLQQGIYRHVVANVKEYIVTEILKIILYGINEKFADHRINTANLLNLIDAKDKNIDEIKAAYRSLFNKELVRKLKDQELFMQLENFFVYFVYLNYDLKEEYDLLDELFKKLKALKSAGDKLNYLEKSRNAFGSKTRDELFKTHIFSIYDNIIELYKILNNKENIKAEMGKPDIEEDQGSEVIAFLDKLYDDCQKNRTGDIAAKITALPHDKDVEVISVLKFDPRFEEFYPEVEDSLYLKDWGRTLGVIVYKVKELEKRYGSSISEEYLDDLEERLKFKFGENAFIARKVRNMRMNLGLLHKEGTKKLHYLNEKLTRAKTSAEKIVELQRISRDPRFRGIFGTIKNLERILVRDRFEEIYEKVKNLPVDTQMVLFQGIREDLKSLLKYEPEIVNKVMDYIDNVKSESLAAGKKIGRVDDRLIEKMDKFEKKEIPLSDLAGLMNIEMPDKNDYSRENIDISLEGINYDVNNGIKGIEELDSLMNEVNNDLSLFKIDQSAESDTLIKNAKVMLDEIDRSIVSAEKLEELKNEKNLREIVSGVFENNNEGLSARIDRLDAVFNSRNYNIEDKAKGFMISAKKAKDPESRTKLNDIVEVIRRMEKEVEPLKNLESRVNMLTQWIEKDYKDREHIADFLKKQIREMGLKIGKEGGLLRQLMEGLEQSSDKTGYLKEMMLRLEYRHLIPVIKTLLENLDDEKKIMEEDINEELIDRILYGMPDNEKKLSWLKVRKYWDKYEKHQEYIDGRMDKFVRKGGKEEIYRDIIDLAERVLELSKPGERQSLIKDQMDNDSDADNLLTGQRKLLFYLMSSDSDVPRDRVKSLAQRITLSSPEKQKYLQLLKKSGSNEKGLLKDKLNIADEDIAYFSLMILYPGKSADARVKYLERFKDNDDEKINQYKAAFDINDAVIDDVIKDLKKMSLKKEEDVSEASSAGEKEVFVKEEEKIDNEDDFKKLEAIMKGEKDGGAAEEAPVTEIEGEMMQETGMSEEPAGLNEEKLPDKDALKGKAGISGKQAEKKKNKLEYNDESDKGFTEEELKELTEDAVKPAMDHKSSKEIINEQKYRDEFKKSEERFKAEKVNKIQNRILSLGEKSKAIIAQSIQKKARQIYEDKHKKIEEKITDIISYLTTCYTEAITRIIDEEILPVFKEEGINLNAYNLLNSINNSVFKPVLQNRDVEDNVRFLEKTLNKHNIDNIRLIVEKLKTLWKSVERQVQKEHDDFDSAIRDINQGRGVSSLLIYLDNLDADNVIREIDDNLLPKIQNEKVKEDLKVIRNNFTSVFNNGLLKDKREMIFKELNLNNKYQEIFDGLIEKIKLLSIEEAVGEKKEAKVIPEKQEVKEEKTEEAETLHSDNDAGFTGTVKKPEKTEKSPADNIASFKEKVKKAEEKEKIKKEDASAASQEDDFSFIEIPKIVEDEFSKVNKFIKPHLFLLDISRSHKLAELADVNNRKKIIEKLYKKGKIFTYDGSAYIGHGQINNLVTRELIPKVDRSKFVDRLDNFLNRFPSKEEVFSFLGVQNEMDFRKLNFLLDKYNVNRTASKFTVSSEVKGKPADKEKQLEPSLQTKPEEKEAIKASGNSGANNKKQAKYFENLKQKVKDKEKKKLEKKEKVQNFMINRKDFVNKNQRELLNMAKNEINNRLKNLIKSADSRLDLDAVYKNYFGDNELHKRNMLNLCGNIRQISDIIRKDPALFNKLSFDREKLEKIFDDKYRKYK